MVFDTETTPHVIGSAILHTLALWEASITYRHNRQRKSEQDQTFGGTSATGLVELIEKLSTDRETLWVFAHNLSFDLAVTRLPVLLIEHGWELTRHALASDAPWARLRKGKRRVTLANSASYLPASVEELGRLVGQAKLPLPSPDDLDALRDRCRVDVAITREALIDLMDWWDEGAYGNWSITGPATGWGAYRHIPMGVNVLIDPDPIAVAFERGALLAGRREAWHVGRQRDGFYLDLDIEHAHLTACATQALPYQRMKGFDSLPLDTPYLRASSMDVLAEATIHTDTPRYPLLTEHGIFYPVGTFRTQLSGPELREALARNELVAIGKGFLYRVGAHMARWGTWMRELMEGGASALPGAVGVAVKAWSRSVPGRWANRTSELLTEYADRRPGWWLEHGTWGPERWPVSYLTIGGIQSVLRRDVESENSFPAVLAWIQSWCRVWLGRLVDLAGDAVIQCNTDGLIVDAERLALHFGRRLRGSTVTAAGAERQIALALSTLNEAIAPARVRVKRTARTVRVVGAQHVILDSERRLSGVPREAAEIGDLRFRYWSWPGLAGQLLGGDAPGFVQREEHADLSRVTVNRYVTESGRTEAPTATMDQAGGTTFLPYDLTHPHGPALHATHVQHEGLPITYTAQPALMHA